jgi:hypothetical protein
LLRSLSSRFLLLRGLFGHLWRRLGLLLW